jgi:hypothetical protein
VGWVGWRTPSAKRLACRLGCCQSSGEGPADGGREMTGSVSLTGPEIRSTVKLGTERSKRQPLALHSTGEERDHSGEDAAADRSEWPTVC